MIQHSVWVAVAAAGCISSAMGQTEPVNCTLPEVARAASAPKAIAATGTPIRPLTTGVTRHCYKGDPSGCKHDVAVTIENGKCVATLPYHAFCVHTDHGKFLPKLVWTLKNGPGVSGKYVFAPTQGIDIPGAQPAGGKHFDQPGHDGAAHKFKWLTATAPTTAAGLGHVPIVYPKDLVGDPNAKCDAKDPVIVNTDN